MSGPSTQTAPAPTVGRDHVRIVLFGMPAAGKSSLLGALAQGAQTQEHLLHGRLVDLSQGLSELQQRLYDETPQRTVDEIIPYPVVYESFGEEDRPARRQEAVLIDCDGRVANDLLVRRKSLDPHSAEGTLAYEVHGADTLVLVLDASAPPAQVDADFAEFGRFLRLLERSRGQRAEVGGLPVFLVLAKCDLLAGPKDASHDWMEHIEERKRQVDERFRTFLKRKEEEEGPLPFGRIDLHLWATAVKRPPLADAPARPREPYGVAELFRQCLHAAGEFRQRRRHSSHRLFWTAVSAFSFIAVLGVVGIWLAMRNGESQAPSELVNKVETYRLSEGQTASARLEGEPERLAQRIAVLTELKDDRNFAELSPADQQYINDRLKELQEYLAYYKKLRDAGTPTTAGRLRQLQELEDLLRTTLDVPRREWGQTRAARLRAERLDEIESLRKAVKKVEDWYRQLREEGDGLWTFARRTPGAAGASIDWRSWQTQVRGLLEQADRPRFSEPDWLPGPNTPAWRDAVLRFESVVEARADWEQARHKLTRLLDLSAALGLGSLPDRPAVLVLADQASLSPAEARQRLGQLSKAYPNYEQDFRLTSVPEAAEGDIRQAARVNYANLLEPGREAILRRLRQAGAGDAETPQRWQEVLRGLQAGADEFTDWRVLARVLKRLHDPDADQPDPLSDLMTFLSKDQFDLTLRVLTVRLPRDLGVRPQGNLVVYHESGGKTRELTFEPFGEPKSDPQGRATAYSFRPIDNGSIVYRPGDGLWARLGARKEGESAPWALSWVRGRSEVFGFEHLSRGAFLHADGQPPGAGKYYEEVRLTGSTDTRIPAVPDLVPVVRLKP